MDWLEVKVQIVEWSGLDRDSLHIYASVAVQLLSALILRRPIASMWPWICAWIVVLWNEYIDLSQFENWDVVPEHIWDAVQLDLWNSMLLPTILFLIARFIPGWMVFLPKPKPGSSDGPEHGDTNKNYGDDGDQSPASF